MRSDHELLLKVEGEEYKVFFEREWEVVDGEIWNDRANRITVNGIPIGHFLVGFADQVREAVDKWAEQNEPPRPEPPEYEWEPKENG